MKMTEGNFTTEVILIKYDLNQITSNKLQSILLCPFTKIAHPKLLVRDRFFLVAV